MMLLIPTSPQSVDRGVHPPPKPMMHIAFPYFSQKLNSSLYISSKFINSPYFCKIYVFLLNLGLRFLLPPIFTMYKCIMLYTYWTPVEVSLSFASSDSCLVLFSVVLFCPL